MAWADVIAAAHRMDHGAQYRDGRGKYDRTKARKTAVWGATAKDHLAKVQSASLLGEARCDNKCEHHRQCMLSAFTVSTLRKCAARVFGNSVLDGKGPSTAKHDVTHIWFDLIFQCRIVNAEGLVERIEFNVEGRRVCGGAFQAVYVIPSATFTTIVRNVMRGDHRW
eukprot:6174778-Pleurochrysis_carterae.AAC.1